MKEEKIFQVSEFNEYINIYLGKVGDVVIEGEIVECRINQGKWLFVTIKDDISSVKVFAVTFKISGYSVLEPGMLVHVYGTPNLYSKTGEFSVYAKQIVPAGEGALRLAFEKLKEKLKNEGLFDELRKRQITEFPERIGLITAKDSKAYGDFIKLLGDRMGGLKIFFYPVSVQGKNSTKSIIKAFNYFNRKQSNLDAIAIIRGGGSLEDLQSFNDENVARAIFSSKVPVICGVGHEDDQTIADLVSDRRASTPSNAAELLVKNKVDVISEIHHNNQIIYNKLISLLNNDYNIIRRCVHSLENAINHQTSIIRSTISKFIKNFALFKQEITSFGQNIRIVKGRILRGSDFWLKQQQLRIENLVRLLNSFDVQKILKRGFSITFDDKSKVLRTIKSLNKGSLITTNLFDGKIGSRVLNVYKK